jgi:enamine deaminase RidA (YjgF/YER057c/UK114 family)
MRDAIITPQWRDFYEATGIPAAVRVGQSVRLTGHTGTRSDGSFSADLTEQSQQTFENIADTLAAVGCTWADVEEITAYHVGLQAQGDLVLEVAGRPAREAGTRNASRTDASLARSVAFDRRSSPSVANRA